MSCSCHFHHVTESRGLLNGSLSSKSAKESVLKLIYFDQRTNIKELNNN